MPFHPGDGGGDAAVTAGQETGATTLGEPEGAGYVVELEEGVELGAEDVVEDGDAAGVDEEVPVEEAAAGLSEDLGESDLGLEEESAELEESLEVESELPELLGA